MHIALVSPDQHESTIDLLCEINAYYHPASPASKETVRAHARQNLLSPQAPHRLVVAAGDDGQVVGLAAVTFAYSLVEPEADRRAQCLLKELFVSASARGQGIGLALMAWVAAYAEEHGCSRIDWPVKAANAQGIAFYERLGARLVEDRLSYRLAGSALRDLARQGPRAGGGALSPPKPMAPDPTDTTTSIVQTLVLYSLAEHQLGHAKTVRVSARGHSFSVEDDGRGHAIGRVIDGSPYLDFVYCHLDYPYKERKSKPVQLQGLGMSLLNRLCAELLVTVRKPGLRLQLRFQNGQLQSHEVTESGDQHTGNTIAGTVHPALAPLPANEEALTRCLLGVVEASPALNLFFNGQPLSVAACGAEPPVRP